MRFRLTGLLALAAAVVMCSSAVQAQECGGCDGGYSGYSGDVNAGNMCGGVDAYGGMNSANCGRGMTNGQAAGLWAGYCNENCYHDSHGGCRLSGGRQGGFGGGGCGLRSGGGCMSGSAGCGSSFGWPGGGGSCGGGSLFGGRNRGGCGGNASCNSGPVFGQQNAYFNEFVGADYGMMDFQSNVSGSITGACGCNGGGMGMPVNVESANIYGQSMGGEMYGSAGSGWGGDVSYGNGAMMNDGSMDNGSTQGGSIMNDPYNNGAENGDTGSDSVLGETISDEAQEAINEDGN